MHGFGMAIDTNTHKLIVNILATITPVRTLLKKGRPLTDGERESLSVAMSVLETLVNLWKVRDELESRFSKNDAMSWGRSASDQRAACASLKRNSAAVLLGYLGASKGGKARAKKLSPQKRAAIARLAAKARWAQMPRPKSS